MQGLKAVIDGMGRGITRDWLDAETKQMIQVEIRDYEGAEWY